MRIVGLGCCLHTSSVQAGTEACPDAPLPLIQPVEGRRLIGFGDQLPSNKRSQGVLIETATGRRVVAPAKGRVTFAGPAKSFGLVIVLDVGCGREISITGAATVVVQAGDSIESGTPIAAMSTVQTANPPVLYIELRENGRPADPVL
jgi:murein hydrolase activator